MQDREQWLAHTFVEITDTLVDDFDIVDFLSTVIQRTVELVQGTEGAVVLADLAGRLQVMAATTERSRILEVFELQTEEGPCLDCYRTGEQILNISLAEADQHWPTFTSMARTAGFASAHALPLRLRDQVIGAVNLFHARDHTLDTQDATLAQALADVATISILQDRELTDLSRLTQQLQTALETRVLIEQAKGLLAERLDQSMEEAFRTLRTHARNNNRKLREVATALVNRELSTDQLVRAPRRGR